MLGIPMFKYLVTSFKCRPKGVSSSGCMNLLLAFAIPKRVESGEESEMRREKFSRALSLVVVSYSQRVL